MFACIGGVHDVEVERHNRGALQNGAYAPNNNEIHVMVVQCAEDRNVIKFGHSVRVFQECR